MGTYDFLVEDPSLLPKKLSKTFSDDLKKRIGRGTKIKIVKSETVSPRGTSWDFGNYTVMEITLPNGKELRGGITLWVARGEASGNMTVDSDFGGVIGLGRGGNASQAIRMILSDAGHHLALVGAKKTAQFSGYYGRRSR